MDRTLVFILSLAGGWILWKILIRRGIGFIWSLIVIAITAWLVYFFLQAIERTMELRGF